MCISIIKLSKYWKYSLYRNLTLNVKEEKEEKEVEKLVMFCLLMKPQGNPTESIENY